MTELESLLKELEEKANAAPRGTWQNADERVYFGVYGEVGWDEHGPILSIPLASYITATNPDTVKKLIAVIRRQALALRSMDERTTEDRDMSYAALDAIKDCEKIVKGDK